MCKNTGAEQERLQPSRKKRETDSKLYHAPRLRGSGRGEEIYYNQSYEHVKLHKRWKKPAGTLLVCSNMSSPSKGRLEASNSLQGINGQRSWYLAADSNLATDLGFWTGESAPMKGRNNNSSNQ